MRHVKPCSSTEAHHIGVYRAAHSRSTGRTPSALSAETIPVGVLNDVWGDPAAAGEPCGVPGAGR
eukprot:2423460-Prymnesium_polylepis.1